MQQTDDISDEPLERVLVINMSQRIKSWLSYVDKSFLLKVLKTEKLLLLHPLAPPKVHLVTGEHRLGPRLHHNPLVENFIRLIGEALQGAPFRSWNATMKRGDPKDPFFQAEQSQFSQQTYSIPPLIFEFLLWMSQQLQVLPGLGQLCSVFHDPVELEDGNENPVVVSHIT
ncbi:hypothetical protein DUI87_04746 [Hirundo rustica rustica]|uniref:Uncharacterized protein n=1 Tax=Hirundo rustica rustica TaxID=333673 RepID=A0A3M0L740_HIRRU|nr:hypothetical protein DUI87_04746 [Hirundo rustica rustica]